MECQPRFDYGSIVPHADLMSEYFGLAHGGRDSISIFSAVPMRLENDGFLAEGTLYEGGQFSVAVTYEGDIISDLELVDEGELMGRLDETVRFWQDWAGPCTYDGEYKDDVIRSALTLKALTYAPTGAIIAAPTTSLPEVFGGVRNWDYRYTWIRDGIFVL